MNSPVTYPIVCGTDYSGAARDAADVAVAIAKRLRTDFLLVHGIDERGEIPPTYWPRLINEDRPLLDAEASRLEGRGVLIHAQITGGVPESGVAKAAEQAAARLIVVGSAGKRALDRWVLGSIAERIAETAWVPTLVVREPGPLHEWLAGERPLRVFVGVDFTASSEAALRCVKEFTEIGPCEITAGFVDTDAGEKGLEALDLAPDSPPAPEAFEMMLHGLRQKARELLGEHQVHVQVLPAGGRVDLRLLELARDSNADLMVIGAHQWHGLSRLRHPSVSRRILHGAKTNVLCVPEHRLARRPHAKLPRVRRVLAATDLSPAGEHSVPYAFSLVEPGGIVCILCVAPADQSAEQERSQLEQLIPPEAAQRGIITQIKVIAANDVAATIAEVAADFAADLISLGSLEHAGAVSKSLAAQSACPVLLVRPPSE